MREGGASDGTLSESFPMARSIVSKQISLAAQAGELLFAVPQVIAHRMMQPGNRGEMARMGSEKQEAATDVWYGTAAQMVRSGQTAGGEWLQAWWKAWMHLCFPWMANGRRARFPAWGMTPVQLQHATLDVMDKAVAPVRRRAVANAKRLSKRR